MTISKRKTSYLDLKLLISVLCNKPSKMFKKIDFIVCKYNNHEPVEFQVSEG